MQIPAGPHELTTEWLTRALRGSGALDGARVARFESTLLTGGLNGQIARLNLSLDAPSAAAPSSVVAKFSASDLDRRALGNAYGIYHREVAFYRRLAPELDLRVPRCFYSDLDERTGEMVLLLEDLSAGRRESRLPGCSLAGADLAVRQIAGFHARWWASPRIEEFSWAWRMGPDEIALHRDGHAAGWRPFVDKLGPSLPTEIHQLGERFIDHVGDFVLWHNGPPATLVHYDFHVDNFFFSQEDPSYFALIDWQWVMRGRGVLDIAMFLGGSLSIADRRAHEMRLLRAYHARLEPWVRAYPFEACLRDYRYAMLFGLMRMVMVIGGGVLNPEEERLHVDVLWPRYCAALIDLEVAELVPA